jgi:cytochrome c oxidase subunit II
VFAALDGAGRSAADVISLLTVMVAGSAVIWLIVTGLSLHGLRASRRQWTERAGFWLIAIGGVAVPTVVLAGLLAFGMPSLARQLDRGRPADLRLTVVGEQWWWRVRYELPGGGQVDLANEVRLPRGRVALVTLASDNVIHSFWIPSLAGKVDMIPGRTTSLLLEPTMEGSYRGLCAEYCGESHARMAFAVEVMEPLAFDRWLMHESQPAATAAAELDTGARAFAANGCGACHTIRGTAAMATIGPDLTHVGGRRTIAAATLPNQSDAIARWIAEPDHFKPGARMPPFRMLPADDLRAIAEYLRSLQ